MTQQLSFEFEKEERMRVIATIAEESKEAAICALKAMLVAYVEMRSIGGVKNGE